MSQESGAVKSAEKLKARGNELFSAGNFEEAVQAYTEAIEAAKQADIPGKLPVLYSNRAAAHLQMDNFVDALADAEEALKGDNKMVKAYHRKASALIGLNRAKEAFQTYVRALDHAAEEKAWVQHRIRETEKIWAEQMRVLPVQDAEDFLERYRVPYLEARDRLSTMAYCWNESSRQERHTHFRTLLRMLVGADAPIPPTLDSIDESAMNPLPTENYADLPPVQPWIDFFRSLSSEEKTNLMRGMWDALDDLEKGIVLNDVRSFIAQALSPELGGDGDEVKQEAS